MCIKKVRNDETITIHSDESKQTPGSRHYIHAQDVADAFLFLITNEFTFEPEWGGAKCPKFNIVGGEEINNYELAKLIADS